MSIIVAALDVKPDSIACCERQSTISLSLQQTFHDAHSGLTRSPSGFAQVVKRTNSMP
jgi:hypothetical protein